MNRLGVQLKKFFEETPIPEGHASWGAHADAEIKAEGPAAFPEVAKQTGSTWRCTAPGCGHRLME